MNTAFLHRFVQAQSNGVFEDALAEIQRGRKESHWIWFIFPQIVGLGQSPTSVYYALSSLEEARLYCAHSLLGPRYRTCVQAVLETNIPPREIFGHLDGLKVCSSLTLFSAAEPKEELFQRALDVCYHGERDAKTLAILAGQREGGCVRA